jgi:nucleotide-binding universal stress UspA family protein
MFRSILVAIDGSDTARRALAEAADLAEALNAQLTVISVAPEVPGYAYRAEIDPAKLEREAEAETERLLRDAVESLPPELPVTKLLKHGHAGEEIVKQVEAGGHDLLALGSRGLGRFASRVLGSVGAYVHFHSNVTMLVVHPRDDA